MPVKVVPSLDDIIARETYLNEPVQWEIAGTLVADVHSLGAAADATRKILTKARNERTPAPSVSVLPLSEPTPPIDTKDIITVLGEITSVAEELDQDEAEELFPSHVYERHKRFPPKRDLGPIELYGPPSAAEVFGGDNIYVGAIPILSKLFAKFKKRAEPTYVRLDKTDAYKKFRAAQSEEMAELQTKVAQLNALLKSHEGGYSGGVEIIGDGYLEVATDIAGDISALFDQVAEKRVPLKLPPFADGKWDCWREPGEDGGTICVSLMLPGPDGDLRIATAATPLADHVVEVCDYVIDSGSSVTELLGVLPTISCMLGGSHLIPRMAKAAPKLLARPEVQAGDSIFVGKIIPDVKPSIAAMMALCQRAQAGDAQALREWKLIARCAEKQRSKKPQEKGLFSNIIHKVTSLLSGGQEAKAA